MYYYSSYVSNLLYVRGLLIIPNGIPFGHSGHTALTCCLVASNSPPNARRIFDDPATGAPNVELLYANGFLPSDARAFVFSLVL